MCQSMCFEPRSMRIPIGSETRMTPRPQRVQSTKTTSREPTTTHPEPTAMTMFAKSTLFLDQRRKEEKVGFVFYFRGTLRPPAAAIRSDGTSMKSPTKVTPTMRPRRRATTPLGTTKMTTRKTPGSDRGKTTTKMGGTGSIENRNWNH